MQWKIKRLVKVQLVRSQNWPTSLSYISRIFKDFVELSRERTLCGALSIVVGLTGFNGRFVTVIGQQKGKKTL